MENPEIKYAPQENDEIDIFHLLEVLLSKWKLLFTVAIIGVAIGAAASYYIQPSFTAESMVKVIKQTLDKYEEDSDLNYHTIKLEGVEIKELLLKNYGTANKVSEQKLAFLNLRLKAKFDNAKNPGILFLASKSNNPEQAIAFLDFANENYCNILNNENQSKRQLKLKQLELNKKEYFDKTESFNKQITQVGPEKTASFEKKLLDYSNSELSYWLNKYTATERSIQKITALTPLLTKSTPAEICSIYKATCPQDTIPVVQNDNENNWSVDFAYRTKENKVLILQEALIKQKNNAPKHNQLTQELQTAKRELAAFSEIIKNQILAHKQLLEVEQANILKTIQKIQNFMRNSDKNLDKFQNLTRQQALSKSIYDKIVAAYNQELNNPQPKFLFEVLNNAKIIKSNFIKRLLPVVIIPILLVGLTAFAFILSDAYTAYNKSHRKSV